jgi:hypothetical protein
MYRVIQIAQVVLVLAMLLKSGAFGNSNHLTKERKGRSMDDRIFQILLMLRD